MIWLLNVNSNQCRIYDYQKNPAQLTFIKELSNPLARHRAGDDLTTDKPGHYQSRGGVHGAYSPHTDPKESEVIHFARDVARELDHGRNTHLYKELILITTPHMIGLLNQHMDGHVKKMVVNQIHNDLIHLKDHELLHFIQHYGK